MWNTLDLHLEMFTREHSQQPLDVVANDVLNVVAGGLRDTLQGVRRLLLQVLDQAVPRLTVVAVSGQKLGVEHPL